MKTCTQVQREKVQIKKPKGKYKKEVYIMKTRTSKLAAIFTSVALAATMLASCGGSR